MDRTLIIVKPDAISRRLVGEIVTRFERKGFRIVGMKLSRIDRDLACRHYEAHRSKPFFDSLIGFITSGPVVLVVLEAPRAVEVARMMIGPTFGYEAPGGTIRGDFGLSSQFNIIHGSDSPQVAEREIALFFRPEELHDYSVPDAAWRE